MRKPYTLAAARDVMRQHEADGSPQEWNVVDFIGELYATTAQARALADLAGDATIGALDVEVVPGLVDALVSLAQGVNELWLGAERLDAYIRADTIVEYDAALKAAQ